MNLLSTPNKSIYNYTLIGLIFTCFIFRSPYTIASHFPGKPFHVNDSTLKTDTSSAAQYCGIAQSTENSDSTIASFNEAAKLYAKHRLWSALLKCTIELSGQLAQFQKHNEVVQLMEIVVEEYPEALEASNLQVATFHFLLGQSFSTNGDYYEALSNTILSTGIRKKVLGETSPDLSPNYTMLSFLYSSLSQPGKALEYAKKNLAVVQETDNPVLLSQAYHFIGNIYHQMQEYNLAVTYFKKAILVINNMEQPDPRSLVRTYVNLGTSYIYLEDFERSIHYLQEALTGARKLGHPYFESAVLSNLGNVYLSSENYEKALESNQLALEKLQGMFGAMHPSLNKPYFNIGKVYLAMKNYDQAETFYRKALQVDTTFYGKVHAYPAETYSGLGNVYEAKEQYDQALSFYQRSISALTLSDSSLNPNNGHPVYTNEIADHFILLETLTNKASTLIKQYKQTKDTTNLQDALETYVLCTSLQSYTRKHMSNEDAKTLFSAQYSGFFESAIQTSYQLYALYNDDKYLLQAANFIEQNKANSLVEALTNARAQEQFNLSDSLFRKENSYKAEIAFLEKTIFEEKTKQEHSNKEQIKKWTAKVFSLNRALEEVVEKIKKTNPQYYKAKYNVDNFDITTLQNQLLEGDLLLDFFVGDSTMYVFSATKNDFHVHAIAAKEVPSQRIEAFIKSLKSNQLADYANQSFSLYKATLEASINHHKSEDINHLIIIPDGILCYLPFEVLTDAPAEDQRYDLLPYLFKDYKISYQYSTELLSLHSEHKMTSKATRTFIGYAPQFSKKTNPLLATRSAADSSLVQKLEQLPLAEQEVRLIAEMLEGDYNIGKEATEEHFKQQTSNGGILHLASHTIIDNENPLYSKLVFSPNQDTLEDGLLHTYELYNLKLNANLVTLSACNTGVGKYYEGEGVMSLARSFMYAGVPNVVTSLWSVPDKSTSEIMTSFYSHMKDGMSKAEALRQAKLDYLANADEITAAPYYWAGFIYIGNDASEETDYSWMAVIAAALVTGLAFIAIKTKKER